MKRRPFEGKESLSLMRRKSLFKLKKGSLQIEERLSLKSIYTLLPLDVMRTSRDRRPRLSVKQMALC